MVADSKVFRSRGVGFEVAVIEIDRARKASREFGTFESHICVGRASKGR